MGYRLDEPIFMAVPNPMLTEFGIHYILESCGSLISESYFDWLKTCQTKGNYKFDYVKVVTGTTT